MLSFNLFLEKRIKTLAIVSFGVATGVLSAVFGLSIADEPVKYVMVNIPLIVCFVAVVNLIGE